jgi:hypothetical protein
MSGDKKTNNNNNKKAISPGGFSVSLSLRLVFLKVYLTRFSLQGDLVATLNKSVLDKVLNEEPLTEDERAAPPDSAVTDLAQKYGIQSALEFHGQVKYVADLLPGQKTIQLTGTVALKTDSTR